MIARACLLLISASCLLPATAFGQAPTGRFTVSAFKQQNGTWVKQANHSLDTDDESKARDHEKKINAMPGWKASSNIDSVLLVGTWKLGQRDFVNDNKDISNYIYLGKDGKAVVHFTGWGDKKPFGMDWINKGDLVIIQANDKTDPISGLRFKREGKTLVAQGEAQEGMDYEKIADTMALPK